MNAHETPDRVELALGELDKALEAVDGSQLDTVLTVLDRVTSLNQLLRDDQVPPEKFAETRARVDRVLISINALLNHLTEERDQVGATIASLAPRLRNLGESDGLYSSRRLDVSK